MKLFPYQESRYYNINTNMIKQSLYDHYINKKMVQRHICCATWLSTKKRPPRQWSARVVFSISRREREFLRFNLVHRDETENSWHLLSSFETRPRKNFLQSRASRQDRDLLSSLSDLETRTRIPLIWSRFSRRDREFWNLPSFQAWTASLFCMQFLGG